MSKLGEAIERLIFGATVQRRDAMQEKLVERQVDAYFVNAFAPKWRLHFTLKSRPGDKFILHGIAPTEDEAVAAGKQYLHETWHAPEWDIQLVSARELTPEEELALEKQRSEATR